MKISLKVDKTEIRTGIISATRSGINSALHLAANDIKRDIMKMIEGLLKNTPEYESLTNGTLKADFGLRDPVARVREILSILKNSVDVSVIPVSTVGDSLKGGLAIVLIRSGFDDILSSAAASYQGKSFVVPWLDWLLLQGDRIIIAGYHVTYNLSPGQKRASMSGVAVMERGGGWRVPPEFSGTVDNNWITRTFDVNRIKSFINAIVENRLMRRLK